MRKQQKPAKPATNPRLTLEQLAHVKGGEMSLAEIGFRAISGAIYGPDGGPDLGDLADGYGD